MRLTALLPVLLTDPTTAALVSAAGSSARTDRTTVVACGARPAVLAAMALGEDGVARAVGSVHATAAARPDAAASQSQGTPLLVITATTREAEETAAALTCYLPESDVAVFPAWETLPHERLSPRADTVATRLSVLRRLAHPEDGDAGADGPGTAADPSRGPIRVLVVPVRALLAPVVDGLGELEPIHLAPGLELGLEATAQRLADAAYTRVDMVENRGEFAVRGGILDVFPPTQPRPVRVDFFGDEIESVSSFAVADQRTIEEVGAVTATACREILLTEEVRGRAKRLMGVIPSAADMLEKIAAGIPVEGMESLAPVLVPRMVPLLDLVGDRLVVGLEPERVRKRAEDLTATTQEFLAAAWTSAASGGQAPVDLSAAAFAHLAEARGLALSTNRGWWSFTSLKASPDTVELDLRDPRGYAGSLDEAVTDLGRLAREGWSVVVATDGPGPGRRMAQLLGDGGVPARIVTQLDEPADLGAARDDGGVEGDGVVRVTQASAGHGFVAEDLRLALIAESDLTGRASAGPRSRKVMPARRSRRSVDPLSLHSGDLVVHAQHGVGRFVELMRRNVGTGKNAATREYVVIEYAPSKRGQPGDRLLVPTDALDQVSKYVGGDNPTLNKMGGADWAKTKSKARKAVREIAGELVRLYAARSATSGHAFAPDTPWQSELEESFPYTETADQLATIDEVKSDMEKAQPMDRLICGDVGYGKTEIAVRAAFKAVQDGKQVAVLVPTTLLVSQHAETFTERYAGFPVRVAQLSRFQSASQSEEVLKGLASGAIDVVIGTHRLITGQVRFKDLGLVIIDEEQRFGVEHKETLKALRTDVDVLSMSATPIPRTLEMAVTGLREMSTLATPPEDRHPILTYVGAYETKQVSAAIRRELLRDGQVFYVHNRVEDIDRVAARIQEMVPEARVATAHGQMGEVRLEQVIDDFWHKEIDVLVCTTIVETGLDVSNANTLIVDRADRMGLSQLHQLRGRVGRGRERAYAYFLYPADKPLTETALERLRTIATNTDLGAGMQVAMKDLEIRGAGNLLGGEQSGHIAGVGFDLYVRMVSEAVAAYKKALKINPETAGDAAEAEAEIDQDLRVELPVDATIPEDYVPHERLRLEAYTKFAAARSDDDVADVLDELTDRYGPVPEPTQRLAALARLRALAARLGVREIVAQGKSIRFAPLDLAESARMRLTRLYPGTTLKPATRTIVVPAPGTARMGGGPVEGEALLRWAEVLLRAVVEGDKDYEVEATTYRRRR
ncbi:transcription-repair coupling factor [Actinomyces urogenitalis DSM 15434]|uniref:Transcription-repair-coupling factor n=1 Tax=Actinomyces urogenitalis DSM 15434 TaxID=525246 RepID=C0W7W3_9ACTO|nr:transcription-repair coupling factor [Actinomyces urogenitalis]EEH65189.1 transcription-repair coupling factor [Actinomyces urogenitalis DSM 15434]KGF02485.1 transcription-repair coupling factor [Actinomyces urogenitalis S6-C4]MDK8238212.1 transcription-repair coupling factor [Actinomyces urogenitalis]MDK8835138.1 transcription-repair coupling factor [Actinomyces urogenitalis]MDU0864720.1 transcription-repair coupling factor [Actinomyces urogenitalis]